MNNVILITKHNYLCNFKILFKLIIHFNPYKINKNYFTVFFKYKDYILSKILNKINHLI